MERALGLALAVMVLLPGATAGQDEPSMAPAFGAGDLEALCEEHAADAGDKELCLYVVHEILVPGSGSVVEPEATEAATSTVYGLQDSQDRDGMMITPIKVDWKVKPTNMFSTPDKGMKYVGVLVRYAAGEDESSYSDGDWDVADQEGFSYDQALIGAEPDLGSGDLRAGRKVQGWVTFEVPKNAKWLEISQTGFFQDPLYWVIQDR